MDAPRFEIYPVNPVREEDVVSNGFRWRFVVGEEELVRSTRYFTRREDAHQAVRDFGLAFGEAVGMPEVTTALDVGSRSLPIIDVDE